MKVLVCHVLVRTEDVYECTDELMHALVHGGSLGGYVECKDIDSFYEYAFAETLQDLKDDKNNEL